MRDERGAGFEPPPYPYEQLDALARRAERLPGGIVDCSIGTPTDPVPDVVRRAASAALDAANGYPTSAGSAALREAAAGWMRRKFDVDVPVGITAPLAGQVGNVRNDDWQTIGAGRLMHRSTSIRG